MLRKLSCSIAITETTGLQQKSLHRSKPVSYVETKGNSQYLVRNDTRNKYSKWHENDCASQCKGIYTWVSSPKALHSNRKLVTAATEQ